MVHAGVVCFIRDRVCGAQPGPGSQDHGSGHVLSRDAAVECHAPEVLGMSPQECHSLEIDARSLQECHSLEIDARSLQECHSLEIDARSLQECHALEIDTRSP